MSRRSITVRSARSVNTLIWALFFVAVFGPGALAGMLAIAFHSIGFTGKLLGEALEEANRGSIEALEAGAAPVGAGFVPAPLQSATPPVDESAPPQPAEAPEEYVAAELGRPEPEPQNAEPEPQPAAKASMSEARLMAAILTQVKRADEASGALLTGVEVKKVPDGYELVFPEGGEFAVRIASTGDTHALIAQAFEAVLGEPTRFVCRVGGTAAAKPAATPDFGTVSAQEAAAPTSYVDDGYEAALAAYADSAYFDPDEAPRPVEAPPRTAPVEPVVQPEPEPEPVPEPVPDDVYVPDRADLAAAIDTATGMDEPPQELDADLADALSVFGSGIQFEEID